MPTDSGAAHEARTGRQAISETKQSPRQQLICISQLMIQLMRKSSTGRNDAETGTRRTTAMAGPEHTGAHFTP